MSTSSTSKFSASFIIKICLTLALSFAIFLVPTSELITMPLKKFCLVTIFSICLMAFELTPIIVPALCVPLGYVIFKVAGNAVIFKSWTTQIPWLLVGSFIIADVMDKTGLSNRLVYWCLTKAKGKYSLLMYASAISGFILAMIIPASVPRTALYCTIMVGVCKALDFAPDSKEAACTMFVAMISSLGPKLCYLTGANTSILLAGQLEAAGYPVTWAQWCLYSAPQFLFTILSVTLALFVFKPNVSATSVNSQDYIEQQYKSLGKMNTTQKKLAVLMTIAILMLIFSDFTKIAAQWVFLTAGMLCFIPGIDIADKQTTRNMNWPMILLITACAAIGDVAGAVGAGDAIVALLAPIAPNNIWLAYGFEWIIGIVGNLAMTPLAACSTFCIPMIELCKVLGTNPIGVAMMLNVVTNETIFPYEVTSCLCMYGFGYCTMPYFIKFSVIKMIFCIVCTYLMFVPWFMLMGVA